MESVKPYRESRPWGEFVEFTKNSTSTVKIITVMPGEALSLQTHKHRDEFWHVISGDGTIQIGSSRLAAKPGDEFFAARGTAHRMEGGEAPLQILEISFGEFDEADISRLEDRYGRAGAAGPADQKA
ncbi:MAG: phosphomannose isomerase type II C-terminal cupin domain [Patescibacteria group bacterium]|nr:phosphomannose isomerase type II C-terminal cupin domain [Patescibacteria group bacterium]MDE1941060.1 phosphomannose isomerase type II C-terminal cupin domain [Patescibacteria group bacterium]MDE1966667.1 phosphomannose isomerase type II C-terminal cupin domain [Patescibacteria group bacterium]